MNQGSSEPNSEQSAKQLPVVVQSSQPAVSAPSLDEQIAAAKLKRGKQLSMGLLFAVVALGAAATGSWWFASKPATPIAAVVVDEVGYSDSARKALQQQLADTKASIQALEAQPSLAVWGQSQLSDLAQQLEEAYQAYGQQHFSVTTALLNELAPALEQLPLAYQHEYEAAFAKAEAAFTQKQWQSAQFHLDKTLQLNPTFAPAQQLQQRLAVIDELTATWEQYHQALASRSLQAQAEALERILRLDANQVEAQQKLPAVKAAIKQQAFAQQAEKVVAALAVDDLDSAASALQAARKIDASRQELNTLSKQLQDKQQAAGEAGLVSQLQTFSQLDEWQTVGMLAEKGLPRYPNNSVVRDFYSQAQRINSTAKKLAGLLAKPERLSDENIRAHVNQVILEATPLAAMSGKLAQQVEEVKDSMAQQNAAIAVQIISDNKTSIRVLGVGNVGVVKEKTIQLKPGMYRFEASRQGYQTEIIEVQVAQTIAPLVVEIICRKKI
ncbi:hypothetical protein ACFOEE_16090 [Pseudoalteromonas fenneropenaei]|uniref:PEGA domain-containing protein n=1 Tax=Pseudoalteromonas fenneropenaei TaxID=1737459 RepID=A0ABV7CMY1_9GAMM